MCGQKLYQLQRLRFPKATIGNAQDIIVKAYSFLITNFLCRYFKIIYKSLDNPVAKFEPVKLANTATDATFVNLAPNSSYEFRFNINLGDTSGPVEVKTFRTLGKSLPR